MFVGATNRKKCFITQVKDELLFSEIGLFIFQVSSKCLFPTARTITSSTTQRNWSDRCIQQKRKTPVSQTRPIQLTNCQGLSDIVASEHCLSGEREQQSAEKHAHPKNNNEQFHICGETDTSIFCVFFAGPWQSHPWCLIVVSRPHSQMSKWIFQNKYTVQVHNLTKTR